MPTQTSSKSEAGSLGDGTRTFEDLTKIVEAMQIGETRLVRLLDAPEGMVPDCGLITFHLNGSPDYRISVIQPDRESMPDYIELIKSYAHG